MIALTIQSFLNELVAFALTYLLHSSTWILLVLCLVKIPFFNTPLLKNYLWKGALIGGLLTSMLIHFSGNSLLEISLSKKVISQPTIEQQPVNEEVDNSNISKTISPIEPTELIVEESVIDKVIEKETSTTEKPLIVPKATLKTTSTTPQYILLAIQFFVAFWLIGSLFFFLKESIRHFIFIKKISPRTDLNHPTLPYLLKQIRLKLGKNPQILLSQSALLESPILIKNKEICLPKKAVDKLDDTQMKAMLAHELAHVIRKDYYWNCFFLLLDTLLFFQPLHRIAIKEIQTTNELLCDEWAAKIIGNNLALAQCLLTVAEWMKTPTKNYPLIAGISLKKSELSNRIISLINLPDMKKQRYHLFKAGLPFAALLLLALFVLPGFTFTNTIDSIIDSNSIDDLAEITIEEPPTYHQYAHVDVEDDEETATEENNIGAIIDDNLSKVDNESVDISQPKRSANTVQRLEENSKFKYLDISYTRTIDVNPNLYQSAISLATKKESLPQELKIATPTIKLENKFEINKNHPYFNTFHKIKVKDGANGQSYIKAIYYTNLGCAGSNRQKIGGPLVTNKGDKNSLIFTLDYGTHIEYDTLQNCVHPPNSDASEKDGYEIRSSFKRIKNFLLPNGDESTTTAIYGNVDGSLPEVVASNWVEIRDNQKQTPIGIKLRGKANVKIAIETTKGQPVMIITDSLLEAGTHEFIFPHVDIKKGTYRLVKTVNGENLTQNIRVRNTRSTNKKEKNTCAALLRAVKKNNAQKVKTLVQTVDPNCEYREEGEPRSPLNAAARKGNIEIGKILLAANADVEFRARGDEGALMGAARYGHLDFVKLMIENGAAVNKTVGGDGTALINAVRGGHYEVAEYLLENGADPMLGVAGDENPITHAVDQGDKMLDLLLKYRKSK